MVLLLMWAFFMIRKHIKIYGNVKKEVEDIVKYITPVPGGIGPMTVALFIENILICYKNQMSVDRD